MHRVMAIRLTFATLFAVLTSFTASADEGMWTFHDFPAAAVKEQYGVEITPAWLDRVRTATVRLANCTASFVSPDGLILTNHHCAASCLAENSSRETSLLEQGVLAAARDKEIRCPTQIADVLMGTENVSVHVSAAMRGLDDEAANKARKMVLTQLEQACEQQSRTNGVTGALKCESVNLYEGGQHFLYKYKRYRDVRLAFAPEEDIAAFGGDPDNFQFPRWSFDMALMRAYDASGAPAQTPNHLSIDFAGPDAGELVFVSGHPGSTDRLLTASQLRMLRDVTLPRWLLRASELRGRYIQFARSGPEHARIVQDSLSALENRIKVRRRLLDALHEDRLLEMKEEQERKLRERIAADPQLARAMDDPWAAIADAQQTARALATPHTFLEESAGFNGRLFGYARALVRAATERTKPNEERLREYTEAQLARLRQQLAADVPVYSELEILTLSFSLERLREWLGPDHPLVRELLASDSPQSLAERLVKGSQLDEAETRLKLWEGGLKAIEASEDPMILLAQRVEPYARSVRKQYEDKVEAPVRAAAQEIARTRFAVAGTNLYPDATFTLRLNFGSVQGWTENGEVIQPFTYLRRLFERATGIEPFKVPPSWKQARDRLNLDTKFNLATNNDIVGGNSGSPLIDAEGRVVGLIFDGNIHSIAGSYRFDAANNRSIAVHPAIMLEALTKVYGADALLAELGHGRIERLPSGER